MNFLRDPIWQFIGVIISAIGTCIPLIIAVSSRKGQVQSCFVRTLFFVFLATTLILIGIMIAFTFANSSNLNLLSMGAPRTTSQLSQAQTMIQQFYDNINERKYCDAYKMWIVSPQNPPSCQEFSNGYQNTAHVDINFDSTQSVLSSDGRVYITLHVTNKVGNNDSSQIIYNGWYVVEQENGLWKIKAGYFT